MTACSIANVHTLRPVHWKLTRFSLLLTLIFGIVQFAIMTRVAALAIKRNTPLASGYQVLGKFTQFRLAFSISPTADMKQANNDMQGSQGGWLFPEDLLFAGVGGRMGIKPVCNKTKVNSNEKEKNLKSVLHDCNTRF